MINNSNLIELTSDIVSSHVTNNHVAVGDLANLIQQVHGALSSLEQAQAAPEEAKRTPAVSIRASVTPDYLTCLECGKKQKTLKRHLQTAHGMTPAEYRQAFGLSADYPMTAQSYSERRSDMAKSIGLGSKGRKAASAAAKPEPKKGRGRKPKEAAATRA